MEMILGAALLLMFASKRKAEQRRPPPPPPPQDTGEKTVAGDLAGGLGGLASGAGLAALVAAGSAVGNAAQSLYSSDNRVAKVAAPIVGAAGGVALWAIGQGAATVAAAAGATVAYPILVYALPVVVAIMAIVAEINAVEDDVRWARWKAAYDDVYGSLGDPEIAFQKAVKYMQGDDSIRGLGFHCSASLIMDKPISCDTGNGPPPNPLSAREMLDRGYRVSQEEGDLVANELDKRFPYVFPNSFKRDLAKEAAIRETRKLIAANNAARASLTPTRWAEVDAALQAKLAELSGISQELRAEMNSQTAWDRAAQKRQATVELKTDRIGGRVLLGRADRL